MTPEERWSNGIPHCRQSLRFKRFVQSIDESGEWEFGGDSDNGEEILYLLDAFYEQERRDWIHPR